MTEPFSNPAVLPSLLWAKTVHLLSSQVSFIALVLPSFRHFLGDSTMEKLLLPARPSLRATSLRRRGKCKKIYESVNWQKVGEYKTATYISLSLKKFELSLKTGKKKHAALRLLRVYYGKLFKLLEI